MAAANVVLRLPVGTGSSQPQVKAKASSDETSSAQLIGPTYVWSGKSHLWERFDFAGEIKGRGEIVRMALTSNPQYHDLAAQLCVEHPAISVDKGIFGGVPHIKNVRLAVGDVLAHLYMLGSVDAVVKRFSPDISEEQVKEALAYAQDFIDIACDPHA
jgi:uncharacterized protein (DUF433 family)